MSDSRQYVSEMTTEFESGIFRVEVCQNISGNTTIEFGCRGVWGDNNQFLEKREFFDLMKALRKTEDFLLNGENEDFYNNLVE